MTAVGIMASSVANVSAGTDVLLENFESITDWTASGSWTPVTGRSGQAISATNSGPTLTYTIPAPSESDIMIVGFGYKVNNASLALAIASFRSDTAVTGHLFLTLSATGALEVRRQTSAGPLLATSAAGAVVANTWCYVELHAKLHDTTGFVTLRVNAVQVAAATPVDTKNAGTKTTFDALRLHGPTTGLTNYYDDLYITTGSTAAFKGDITVP